jgi:hypothetical protein
VADAVGSGRIRVEGEVDGFYWTDLVPDIVNSGQEEQGSDSV